MNPELLSHMMSQMALAMADTHATQRLQTRRPPPAFNFDMPQGQLEERIAEYKIWFEERQLGPEPAPYVSRWMLVSQLLGSRALVEKRARDGEYTTGHTVVGIPKHSSSTPVDQLKPDEALHRRLSCGTDLHFFSCYL